MIQTHHMSNLLFEIRFYLAKLLIDCIIFGYALFLIGRKKALTIGKKNKTQSTLSVFQISSGKDFSLSLVSLLSLHYFIPQIKITYLNDGTLQWWQLWILRRLPLPIHIHDESYLVEKQLARYPNCKRFFNYAWSGKKFFIPIIISKKNPILILDSDALFLDHPKEIYQWLQNPKGSFFMQDYKNFHVVSPAEVKEIIGKKPSLINLNSGLLGFNATEYKQYINLSTIEKYLTRVLDIVKLRTPYDDFLNDDLRLQSHLLEQTLFWLTLESFPSKALPTSYFLCNQQVGRNLHEVLPKTVIHFAGDPTRKSFYRFLYFSAVKYAQDYVYRAEKNSPWFIRGNEV
jgi:hypothetical protein